MHHSGAAPDTSSPLSVAAHAVAVNSLGSDQLTSAVAALEQAFQLNPSDVTGELSALLGRIYFHQQRYGDAVRHLEAAATKRPDDESTRHVLERAVRNCETAIERPTAPLELTDAVRIVTPPAVYLRAPDITAPLPFDPDNPWTPNSWIGMFQGYGGTLAGIAVGVLLRGIRMVGINDEVRSAWERRKGLFGLLTLGAYREWLHENVMQDPYQRGELTAHQQSGQKRPEWTKTMPTANGSWRTDDPMEGAALARSRQSEPDDSTAPGTGAGSPVRR